MVAGVSIWNHAGVSMQSLNILCFLQIRVLSQSLGTSNVSG
jgi:hypothetical protein